MMDEWNKNRALQPDHAKFERHESGRKSKRRADQDAECKAKLEDELDRGLEDTFPGSDPVSITQPPRRSRHKPRP